MKLRNIIFLLLIAVSFLAKAQNASVKGVVIDGQNNEPLPFANIKVVGQDKGAVSDLDGKFVIHKLESGFTVLEVSFLGYVSKKTEKVLLINNKTQFIEITLEPQTNTLKGVDIRPASFVKKEETPISMQSIGLEEIESNPGSNRDISRVIQSFPGVGSTPAFRNDIIVRGGGPSENRFYLDDVEIPVLNHFATQGASGGPVGIINADFIRNVDFYSSAFPAHKYNALSSVMDFKQKDGNPDKMAVQFAVGASEASLTLDGPLGKKTSYVFSVRRSYLQFLFSALGLPFLPTFNDYQLKVKTKLNPKNHFTLISIGSLDFMKINTGLKDPTPSQQAILTSIPVNNQWSYTIGGVYKHFFDKGYHQFVLSRNKLSNELYKYPENDETKPRMFDYVSSETENKLRYEYHLRYLGFKYVLSNNFEYAEYTNNTKQKLLMANQVFNLDYGTSLNLFKYGLSGHVTRRFVGEQLLVSAGFRMDGNNYNKTTTNLFKQFSPRLALSYDLNYNLKVNMGAGRYYQQAAYTTLGFRDRNDVLVNKDKAKFIGLNQYNLGLERFWGDKVMVSVEGFYKDYFNYPVDVNTGTSLANQSSGYFLYGATEVDFVGKGEALGVEVLNRWSLEKFSVLASYTFFRSRFTSLNGRYVDSDWDSKHLFSITLSKKFKRNWQIGAKWRFVGGLPYTPYDLQRSANKAIWAVNNGPVLDYQMLNSARNSAFHQLDMRVDKNFFFNKWALMIYFDLQNVYNSKNDAQEIITRKKNPDGSFQTDGQGNYILESHKNMKGIVLPALGIMIKF